MDFAQAIEDTRTWTGRQALALFIFLPTLQSASMFFAFNFQDAIVVNTHLPSLLKSERAISNIRNLSLQIHQYFPETDKEDFNFDSTFKIFLSIFKCLENVRLSFFENSTKETLRQERMEQCPSLDLLKGLFNSAATLKSLSFKGQVMGKDEEKNLRDERFISTLQKLNLIHLRVDTDVVLSSMYGVETGVKHFHNTEIETLELASNRTRGMGQQVQQQAFDSEVVVSVLIEMGALPKNLRLIRSPAIPTVALNLNGEEEDLVDMSKFEGARLALLRQAELAGIEVEFV